MSIFLIFIFVGCLLYHTYTDLKEMLLYDWVNLLLGFCGLSYAYKNNSILDAAYGFGIGFAVMLAVYLISRGGLGEGDVKLVPCLGLWLGMEKTLLCLLLAFILGAVIGIALMFINKKNFNTAIPFGPFLCFSAFISFFFGNEMINLYWQIAFS